MAIAPRPAPPPLCVVFDTNIILDVALARSPWAADAVALLDRAAKGTVRGAVASHAVTTFAYLIERARGRRTALTAVADLLATLEVVPLGRADFQRALALGLKDFEDAVQVAACLQIGADFLVSRDPKDFRGAPVTVRSAAEVLAALIAPTRRAE